MMIIIDTTLYKIRLFSDECISVRNMQQRFVRKAKLFSEKGHSSSRIDSNSRTKLLKFHVGNAFTPF